ncbi:Helix-turn-helix domain-containing protein [Klenkia soli]|uniref:Helix-turn-helix domain-containing protein n=1 Tax=Klenkia soli TaxID=1052260 RepID=A0A1H0GQX3_9ACTN|nr:helix-turn-helix transcriptional regulator [Klenkia soli]SDO09172.1 Helix-turn-helix domain-containing protein [Klenkia soli]
MDDRERARAAVQDFLSTRRERISPADVGLPATGTRRRVKGLRREEVALLAGISPEYYVRLERGQATGPSPGVVEAIARVLRLDEDERTHLDRVLAALVPGPRRRPGPPKEALSLGMQVLLDALTHLPAMVFNPRLDVLAFNPLARALYASVLPEEGPVNTARLLFLEEQRFRTLVPDWEDLADDAVSVLRVEAGRRPDDPALTTLVGQLSTRSAAFRTRWAANDVRAHRGGVKTFDHPLVGHLQLPYENLTVDAAGDQVLTVFTPQPGSPAHDSLQLLASLVVTAQPSGPTG